MKNTYAYGRDKTLVCTINAHGGSCINTKHLMSRVAPAFFLETKTVFWPAGDRNVLEVGLLTAVGGINATRKAAFNQHLRLFLLSIVKSRLCLNSPSLTTPHGRRQHFGHLGTRENGLVRALPVHLRRKRGEVDVVEGRIIRVCGKNAEAFTSQTLEDPTLHFFDFGE